MMMMARNVKTEEKVRPGSDVEGFEVFLDLELQIVCSGPDRQDKARQTGPGRWGV